jgi:hypothetical protein
MACRCRPSPQKKRPIKRPARGINAGILDPLHEAPYGARTSKRRRASIAPRVCAQTGYRIAVAFGRRAAISNKLTCSMNWPNGSGSPMIDVAVERRVRHRNQIAKMKNPSAMKAGAYWTGRVHPAADPSLVAVNSEEMMT